MNINELYKRILTSIILLPIIIFLILSGKFLFFILLGLVFFISANEWYNLNKKKITTTTLIGFFVIIILVLCAYFLRFYDINSKFLLLWIITVCIFSDVGGFFFGKIFGGKKITKISPNKTYSGIIGSLFFSVLPFVILLSLDKNYNLINKLSPYFFGNLKYLFLSVLFSIVCQLGDLIISYFKRLNNVKDTGSILPGHGGILDRIDGLIFVIIFSGILKYFNII